MRSSQKDQRKSKKLALGEAVKTTDQEGPEEGMVLLESRKGLVLRKTGHPPEAPALGWN